MANIRNPNAPVAVGSSRNIRNPNAPKTYTITIGGQSQSLSQEQVDWMRDRYQKSFTDAYKVTASDTERYIAGAMPATYEKSYSKSNLDQQLLSMGLPSVKYLGKFMQDYASWYGEGARYNFNKDQSEYLSKEYKKSWEYSYTPEDQARQKAGQIPLALEQAYGDNYTDYQLMQQGLPPSSKLGDYINAYNTRIGQQSRIAQFYSTLANKVYGLSLQGIDNSAQMYDKSGLVTTTEGAVGIGAGSGVKGVGDKPQESGSNKWENAYYDLLLSPEWADLWELHKNSQSNIDSTKYETNEQYREAQVKLALKTDESDDSPFLSYDDFLDFYNVRGGKKAIYQTAIVDKAVNDYGIETYGELVEEAEKSRSAQRYSTINSRATARAFADDVVKSDPNYSAPAILQDMFDNGVSLAQIQQAKTVFINKAASDADKSAIDAKYVELREYAPAKYGTAAKIPESFGAGFDEVAALLYGTPEEKAKIVAGYAEKNTQAQNVRKENARLDKLVRAGISGAYDKSLFSTVSKDDAAKIIGSYVKYEGEIPDAKSIDAAKKALAAEGYNAREIEVAVYDALTSRNNPTVMQRIGEIAPELLRAGLGDVTAMANLETRAGFALYNAFNKTDASTLEIKEMFDGLRERNVASSLSIDNAMRRAGYGYMLDPIESARNYFLEVEGPQYGMTPEKALDAWNVLDDNGKKLYAENFAKNAMSNPLVHKTVEDVLTHQGMTAIMPKVLASVADTGVGIAGLIVNDPNKDAAWVKEASQWIDGIRNYGRSDQSLFTQGVSLASDAGAELALMYGMNAAGGALMSGTKVGAKLATAATAKGATFITKAAASTLRSTPFLARSFGTYYTSAIKSGAPVDQAKIYALVAGGFEGWLESWTLDKTWGRLFGSENLAKAIKAGGEAALTGGMKTTAKLMSLATAFFGEASEEGISYATSWALSAAQGWNKDPFSLAELGSQALMGGIIGMLGGALTAPSMSARNILAEYMVESGEYKASNNDLLLSSIIASGVTDDMKSQYIAQGYNAIMSVKDYAENQQALTDGRRQLIQGKNEYDLELSRIDAQYKDRLANSIAAESLVEQIQKTEDTTRAPSERYISALAASNKIGSSDQVKKDHQAAIRKLTDAYRNTNDQQNRSIEKAKARQTAHHVVLADFFSPEINAISRTLQVNAASRTSLALHLSADNAINSAFDAGNLDAQTLDAYDSAVKARGSAYAATEATARAFPGASIQSAIDAKMDAMRSGNAKEYMEAERAAAEETAAVATKEKAIIDTALSNVKKYSDAVTSLLSVQFPASTAPRNLDKFQSQISSIAVDILTGGNKYADEYTLLQDINDAISAIEVDYPRTEVGTDALYGHDIKRILDKVQHTSFYQNQTDKATSKQARIFSDEELAAVRGNLTFTKNDKNGQSFQAFYDSLVRDYPLQFPKSSGTSALSILNSFVAKAKEPQRVALGSISNGDIAFDMSEMIAADLMDDISGAFVDIQNLQERGTANEEKPVATPAEAPAQASGSSKVETVQATFDDFAAEVAASEQQSPPRVALTKAEMDEVSELGNTIGRTVQFAPMDDNTDGEFGPNGIILNQNQIPDGDSPMKKVVRQVYFHELLHSLKGSKRYNEYADFVVAAAAKKEGRSATELYSVIKTHRKEVKGIDITTAAARDEVVSMFTAENLDTNQRFVDDLVREQRGVAGRVLNWIHYNLRLVKAKFSKNSAEVVSLLQLERMFTKAFAASDASATEDVRYSISAAAVAQQESVKKPAKGKKSTSEQPATPEESADNAVRYSVSGRGITTLSDLVQKYGAIEPGKEPVANGTPIPRKGGNGENVSYTVRTAVESPNVLPVVSATLIRGVETGKLGTYKAQSNDETMTKANALIAELGGYSSAAQYFINMAKRGTIQQKDSAVMDAMAMQLAADATMRNDPVTALDLISGLVLTGTPAGQTVQIRSLFKDLKGVGQAYYTEKWVEKYNTEHADEIKAGKRPELSVDPALLQDLSLAQTPKEIEAALDAVYRNIGQQIPMGALERLEQWRYFSMLANPITHMRNFVSTGVVTGAMRPAANAIAAKIEDAWVAKGKMETADRRHAIFSRATHPAEFKYADQMWDKYKGTVMAGGKYNIESEIHKYQRMSRSKKVDAAMKLNFLGLEKEDAFWMRRVFRNEFAQYMLAQGLSPDTMTPAQELESAQHAADQARHSAFRDASTAAQTLTHLSNRYKQNPTVWNYAIHGVVEGGMPFKKTPVNVVKVGLEYSPVGLIRGLYDAANNVKSGKVEPAVAIERISRGIVGSGLTVVGALARALGVLRGAGEDDEKYDTYMKDKGEQKFSLSFGNVSISLAAISPATMPLFLGAALYDIAARDYSNANARDVLGQLGSAVAGIVDPIMELSFMSSLNQIIQTFGSEDAVGGSIGAIVSEALGSFASQFIPTIGGKVSQMTGEYYRNAIGDATSVLGPGPDSWLRKQAKKIPGLSSTLEPATSLFGEKKERPVLLEGDPFGLWLLDFANSFVLPGNIKVKDRDAVDEELIRVFEATGESSILPTYRKNKYFTVKGRDLYMNAKQYTQYSVDRGQATYAALKSAMLSDVYQSASYEQRSDILADAVSKAQETVDDNWKVILYDAAD